MYNDYDIRSELIAKINFQDDDDRRCIGTGFLISEDILVTAYHNVESFIKSNKELSITIYKYTDKELCSKNLKIENIICENKEFDVAIIKIDKKVIRSNYFEFVDFPIAPYGIYPDTGKEKISIDIFGYVSGRTEQDSFSGNIDSIKWSNKNVILHIEGADDDLFGLSGSPLIINGFMVYGVNIEQYDPQLGKHVEAVTTSKMNKFLCDNDITVKKYDDYLLIDKDIYKNILLDEVRGIIEEKDYPNESIKMSIIHGAKHVIKEMNKKSVNSFESIISSINLSLYEGNLLSKDYKKYEYIVADIICQIVMLKYAYSEFEFRLTGINAKSIEISNNKYISYIYLFKKPEYLLSIISLFRYFNNNLQNNISGINSIVIGSSPHHRRGCKSECAAPFSGSKVDFDYIIDNICDVEEDPFGEDKKKLNITKIRQNFNDLRFHCEYCFDCGEYSSIDEVSNHLRNVLGE